MPDKPAPSVWSRLPEGQGLKTLYKRRAPGRVPAISSRVNNKRRTAVHVGTLDKNAEAFERLGFARKMIAATLTEKAGTVGIWVCGFDDDRQAAIVRDTVAAALAAGFGLPEFKEKASPPVIASLKVIGLDARLDLDRVVAEAEGNNLARWLTALPPNKLDAAAYAKLLRDLAKQYGWQYRKYGVGELAKMGAGAFLAVAQGNADDSASIVRLRYRPKASSASPALCLVGKGIIFDTGGTNLKPFQSMLDMHIDMGGSAVAVGTLLTLTRLAAPVAVDCWLAITENRTSATAYKSQDVVTALNGKTIQAIHTDAEGRMALADTLVLAGREKPGLIIDYATLTGACVSAVTTRMSGVFTNRPDLHPLLKKGGRECGERVWPFPLGKEFLEDLKSEVADIKQCTPNGGGDHILAATFLNEFVDKDVPWVHIDLSAAMRKGGLAHIATEVTGFGVRLSAHLVLDRDIIAEAGQARRQPDGK
ncbi:MAG: leucyl aminopeptidase family protein [Gammaproteobacteria bacterium]|nr:leucyl aminopeptidase family protein [Gammaproteobacteria bacterium]